MRHACFLAPAACASWLLQIPKLLAHRLFPNAQFSIWVDAKLELRVDPYKLLERWGPSGVVGSRSPEPPAEQGLRSPISKCNRALCSLCSPEASCFRLL